MKKSERSFSFSSGSNNYAIISKYPTLQSFFSKNQELKPYVYLTENVDIGMNRLKFSVSRNGTHELIKRDLKEFIEKLEYSIQTIQENIFSYSKNNELLEVNRFDFDDINGVLAVRKLVFIRRLIQETQISLLTRRFHILSEILKSAQTMQAFYDDSIIPLNVKCQLDTSFFDIHFGAALNKELKMLEYLKPCEKRFEGHIKQIPKALWQKNFPVFMDGLIHSAIKYTDPDLSYFTPLNLEISLSRCFFNPKSPHRKTIDTFLTDAFKNSNPTDFIQKLVTFCYNFLSDFLQLKKMAVDYQSAALVLVYRSFFDRTYEKFSSFFASTKFCEFSSQSGISSENKLKIILKIEEMKKEKAVKFPILSNLMRPNFDEIKEKHSIRFVFQQDPIFFEAAEFFNTAIFRPNPLDALFEVNRTLITIHRAALTNRFIGIESQNSSPNKCSKQTPYLNNQDQNNQAQTEKSLDEMNQNENQNHQIDNKNQHNHQNQSGNSQNENQIEVNQSQLEKNPSETEKESELDENEVSDGEADSNQKDQSEPLVIVFKGDDSKQLLSFDDLFSLFFGTLMAADLPDIFSLAAFIDCYAPKACLSPSFEYAQANMEALVLHCVNVEKEES
ncbi:hypothetical protein TRFO_14932 [Tritrichomonas foetus]|uniref:VPS9 domain-containing protein n=1 Tax=Tritrichomonas foetus TaxID=1144522 RepID=A0A1J4KU22_9EUKA|nr:hypothetical protein TRFO_14932 [Tritrichomonas foetus]|eukprot:OHT14634.1 hypothetical protein TRFO_14932 [Tritrichomonas foetus]